MCTICLDHIFIRMHIVVKEPIEEVYRQGDILKYYGLEIAVGDLEIYDFKGLRNLMGNRMRCIPMRKG